MDNRGGGSYSSNCKDFRSYLSDVSEVGPLCSYGSRGFAVSRRSPLNYAHHRPCPAVAYCFWTVRS